MFPHHQHQLSANISSNSGGGDNSINNYSSSTTSSSSATDDCSSSLLSVSTTSGSETSRSMLRDVDENNSSIAVASAACSSNSSSSSGSSTSSSSIKLSIDRMLNGGGESTGKSCSWLDEAVKVFSDALGWAKSHICLSSLPRVDQNGLISKNLAELFVLQAAETENFYNESKSYNNHQITYYISLNKRLICFSLGLDRKRTG